MIASTTDAKLKFTDKCYSSFYNKKSMIQSFLDISKAFDTVDPNILLRKLECYGFRGFMLELFSSYPTVHVGLSL